MMMTLNVDYVICFKKKKKRNVVDSYLETAGSGFVTPALVLTTEI